VSLSLILDSLSSSTFGRLGFDCDKRRTRILPQVKITVTYQSNKIACGITDINGARQVCAALRAVYPAGANNVGTVVDENTMNNARSAFHTSVRQLARNWGPADDVDVLADGFLINSDNAPRDYRKFNSMLALKFGLLAVVAAVLYGKYTQNQSTTMMGGTGGHHYHQLGMTNGLAKW